MRFTRSARLLIPGAIAAILAVAGIGAALVFSKWRPNTSHAAAAGAAISTEVAAAGVRYTLSVPRREFVTGERVHASLAVVNASEREQTAWRLDSECADQVFKVQQVSRPYRPFYIELPDPFVRLKPGERNTAELALFPRLHMAARAGERKGIPLVVGKFRVWFEVTVPGTRDTVKSTPLELAMRLPGKKWQAAYKLYEQCTNQREPWPSRQQALQDLAINYPDAPFLATACLSIAKRAEATPPQDTVLAALQKLVDSERLPVPDQREVRYALAHLYYTMADYPSALNCLRGAESRRARSLRQQVKHAQESGDNPWRKWRSERQSRSSGKTR